MLILNYHNDKKTIYYNRIKEKQAYRILKSSKEENPFINIGWSDYQYLSATVDPKSKIIVFGGKALYSEFAQFCKPKQKAPNNLN